MSLNHHSLDPAVRTHPISVKIKKELTYCENFIEDNTIAPTEKKHKNRKQELFHSKYFSQSKGFLEEYAFSMTSNSMRDE